MHGKGVAPDLDLSRISWGGWLASQPFTVPGYPGGDYCMFHVLYTGRDKPILETEMNFSQARQVDDLGHIKNYISQSSQDNMDARKRPRDTHYVEDAAAFVVLARDPADGGNLARESAMDTAAKLGMRFVDQEALDALSYDEIGDNDFVYLETQSTKQMNHIYYTLFRGGTNGKSSVDEHKKKLDWARADWARANPLGPVSDGDELLFMMYDRCIKQMKAGGGMMRMEVGEGDEMPGVGAMSYCADSRCTLFVDVSDPGVYISSALANRSRIFQKPSQPVTYPRSRLGSMQEESNDTKTSSPPLKI